MNIGNWVQRPIGYQGRTSSAPKANDHTDPSHAHSSIRQRTVNETTLQMWSGDKGTVLSLLASFRPTIPAYFKMSAMMQGHLRSHVLCLERADRW